LTIQLLLKSGFDHWLQNRLSLAIKLSKLFKFDHWTVLMGGFNFFIYNLVLKISNDYYFCSYLRFKWFLWSHVHNGELYLFKSSLYYSISIYIILMLLYKNNNIRK
jgi:hypothetical protein